jgi:hypothetical protein
MDWALSILVLLPSLRFSSSIYLLPYWLASAGPYWPRLSLLALLSLCEYNITLKVVFGLGLMAGRISKFDTESSLIRMVQKQLVEANQVGVKQTRLFIGRISAYKGRRTPLGEG